MPLDCSLNADVHNAVDRHIALTMKLDEEDPCKFSLSTPARGLLAYRRVWNCPITKDQNGEDVVGGVPCSTRIISDITEVRKSLQNILDNDGKTIVGCGQKGKRTLGRVPAKQGGKRLKFSTYDDANKWTHPDAKGGVDALKSAVASKISKI